jgi:cobalt-precorrin 5A hydrolase
VKLALFCYSRRGRDTALRVPEAFPDWEVRRYAPERYAEDGFAPLQRPPKPFYGELFAWADAMVFVGACGIAVREIAPHVRSKTTDPAVIALDELGKYVIPLLSGHIGGANALARRLADLLGAEAAVTTATDVNGRFAVDEWAARQGWAISDMGLAKAFSAAILERDLPLASDFPILTELPAGVYAGDTGDLGLCLSWQKKVPFRRTLRLIPRTLHLGLGCRRGTGKEAIRRAVETVLERENLDIRALGAAASIDLKRDEAGLLEYCADLGLAPRFYSAEELRAVAGDFTPSPFVEKVTGVDNVCERAALLGADRLIVRKQALDGVTVALAGENVEVRFG